MYHVTTSNDGVELRRAWRGPMSRLALLCVLLLLPLACCACTIYIGPYEDNSTSASPLPEPNDGSGEEPALDEAQQARKAEAERYTVDVIYNVSAA